LKFSHPVVGKLPIKLLKSKLILSTLVFSLLQVIPDQENAKWNQIYARKLKKLPQGSFIKFHFRFHKRPLAWKCRSFKIEYSSATRIDLIDWKNEMSNIKKYKFILFYFGIFETMNHFHHYICIKKIFLI
jgi:hypothetical protein